MSAKPPVILVVVDRKEITSGAWVGIENDALPHTYIDAVERAGGLALLIPPSRRTEENFSALLDLADGVFLAGGRDLDATTYGRTPHPENDKSVAERDTLEIALARGARDRGMPVFGACRGMQVLNVAFGGTLEQHLADRIDMTPHRNLVGEFTEHRVTVAPHTRLAAALENAGFGIASHHHQAVDELGDGLIASAHADDGVVEAIECPVGSFTLGVQWHPEERLDPEGLAILSAFTAEAAAYRNAKAYAVVANP